LETQESVVTNPPIESIDVVRKYAAEDDAEALECVGVLEVDEVIVDSQNSLTGGGCSGE
jgi:hypothetical protein